MSPCSPFRALCSEAERGVLVQLGLIQRGGRADDNLAQLPQQWRQPGPQVLHLRYIYHVLVQSFIFADSDSVADPDPTRLSPPRRSGSYVQQQTCNMRYCIICSTTTLEPWKGQCHKIFPPVFHDSKPAGPIIPMLNNFLHIPCIVLISRRYSHVQKHSWTQDSWLNSKFKSTV